MQASGFARALNCIVRPVRWMRGGRLVDAGEITLSSRLGKRDASAISRTSPAGTACSSWAAFGAKPLEPPFVMRSPLALFG